jgi:hypothetical protein
MAVLATTTVPGLTEQLYDGMFAQVSGALRAAPGFMGHLGGPVAEGWRVDEVWESQAAAEAFYRDTIAPMMEQAGAAMPETQFRPLHTVVFTRQG